MKISYMQMDIEPGELLMADDFETLDTDRWEVTRGDWKAENGALIGSFRENGGGLIYSHAQFPGDIIMDFYGTMIPPCDNDLNFTFRADGWDFDNNDASVGYVGGLNGWWTSRTGIEKYPGLRLQALSGFKAESGREYHIQTGIVDATAFIAVDGDLIVTLTDPDPIVAENCARVGLGTYCSQIQFRKFRLYRARITPVERFYVPKF